MRSMICAFCIFLSCLNQKCQRFDHFGQVALLVALLFAANILGSFPSDRSRGDLFSLHRLGDALRNRLHSPGRSWLDGSWVAAAKGGSGVV